MTNLPGKSFDLRGVDVDCSTVLGGTFKPTSVPLVVIGELGGEVDGNTDSEVEGINGMVLGTVVENTVVFVVVFTAVNKENFSID